jgi:hypothetical protein
MQRPGRAPDEMIHAFEVFENQHWALQRVRPQLILIVRRSSAPYESAEEVKSSFAELEAALSEYHRKHFGLLVDLRSAPQRNDPEYEKVAASEPVALSRDFARVAVLVRTAAGKLQVGRHIRTSGVKMQLFNDEAEALEYLQPRRP